MTSRASQPSFFPSQISLGLLIVLAVTPPIFGVCNTAPVAVDDFLSIESGLTLFDALANDGDLEGQALSLTILSTDCPGAVTANQGLVSFDPGGSLSKPCTISYEVRNEGGEIARGTIRVTSTSLEIFSDTFDSGGAAAWSSCGPGC